jgi:hypothetical protein
MAREAHMRSLANDYPQLVLAPYEPPCLSLYQPTHRHRPDVDQDPVRFRNLVRALEESLQGDYSPKEIETLLAPFRELASDRPFWQHGLDGLAVLGSFDTFLVYRLQRRVPELAVVADSFHTKPLLRVMQSADRFQVLALELERIRMFEGDRYVLDEIPLAEGVPGTLTEALGDERTSPHQTVASYGGRAPGTPMRHGHGSRSEEVEVDTERFFRVVDRAVTEHHSRPSGLPLLLATLPQNRSEFRRVSQNPFLTELTIDVHPNSVTTEELRVAAWKVLEPVYLQRLAALVERFGTARANHSGSADVADVAAAAVAGRVETLLIEAERVMPGRVDFETGRVYEGSLERTEMGDVLDDLGEQVLRTGGEVVVVPAERMPNGSGLAAIYRY